MKFATRSTIYSTSTYSARTIVGSNSETTTDYKSGTVGRVTCLVTMYAITDCQYASKLGGGHSDYSTSL